MTMGGSEHGPRPAPMTAAQWARAGRAIAAAAALGAVGSWGGLLATWRAAGPEAAGAAAALTALVWAPWLLSAGLGIRAWLAGQARGPDRLAHVCAVLAAAAVPGILLASTALGTSPPPPPTVGCGALDAVCAGLVGSHIALVAANLSFGLVFPGLLPAAAAAVSAALLPRGRPAIPTHVALATFAAAVLWAISAVLGFALGNA